MDRFRVLLQQLVPHHRLTRVADALTHWRFRPWSRTLIRLCRRAWGVDLTDARTRDLDAYPHFNAFFVRALARGTRPLPGDPRAAASPVDGTVSECGTLDGERLLQAKGVHYDAPALLGDAALARRFANGTFATLYLSPASYHRVHMPLEGRLRATRFIPGRLFSVAPFAVRRIPDLFSRNERLVCVFDTPAGRMAQVLVGAMLVAGIETVWHGRYGHPREEAYRDHERDDVLLKRGAEMGRFNYGSTVIILWEPDRVRLDPAITAGGAVRLGQRLGAWTESPPDRKRSTT